MDLSLKKTRVLINELMVLSSKIKIILDVLHMSLIKNN